MKYDTDQGKMAKGLFVEIMKAIEKYDGTLYVPTVLGILEVVKAEIFQNSMRDMDDETD